MMRVEEVAFDTLSVHGEAWNGLVDRMAMPTVFLTWEWTAAWWQVFNGRQVPLLLFMREGDRLAGIAPLALWRGRVNGSPLAMRVVGLYGRNEPASDHLDVISTENDREKVAAAVGDHLMERAAEWDAVWLDHCSLEHGLAGYFRQRVSGIVERYDVAPYLEIEGEVEQILGTFSRKHRYNLRRQQRILFEEQGATMEVLTENTDGEMERALEVLVNLHVNRCHKSAFARDSVIAFHRSFIRLAAPAGMVRFFLVRHEDCPVAIAYCLCRGERFMYFQCGIDPAWERYSPGSVLILEMIHYAAAQGFKVFDFLRGDERYKKFWTSRERQLLILTAFGGSWRATVNRAVMALKTGLRRGRTS